MAPHSITLARKIPWTEEPGGLQSMGLCDHSQVPSLPEVLASLTIKWGQCDWPPWAAVLEPECVENQVLSELSVGPAQQMRAAFLLHMTTVTVLFWLL